MNPEENQNISPEPSNSIEAYNFSGKKVIQDTSNHTVDYQSPIGEKKKPNNFSSYALLIGAIILAVTSYSFYRAYIGGFLSGKSVTDATTNVSIKFPSSCIIKVREGSQGGGYAKGYYCNTSNQTYGLFILKGPENESAIDQKLAFNTMMKGDGNSYTEPKETKNSVKNENNVIEYGGVIHSGDNKGNVKGYFIQKKGKNLFVCVTASTKSTSTEVDSNKLIEFINSLDVQ